MIIAASVAMFPVTFYCSSLPANVATTDEWPTLSSSFVQSYCFAIIPLENMAGQKREVLFIAHRIVEKD